MDYTDDGKIITTQVGLTIHLSGEDLLAAGGPPYGHVMEWDWGDYTGIGVAAWNQTWGFNSAHVYSKPGTYRPRIIDRDYINQRETVRETTVVVEANTQAVVEATDYASLKSALSTNRGGRILLTQDITILDTISFGAYGTPAPTIIDGQGHTVTWNRSANSPVFAIYNGGLLNVRADSAFAPSVGGSWDISPSLVYAHDNVTVCNCQLIQGYAELVSQKASRFLYVVGNRAETLKANFVWAEGSDVVIIDNSTLDSAAEHGMRSGGTTRLAICYNKFGNLDLRPLAVSTSDWRSYDFAKQSLTIHLTARCCAAYNELTGGRVELGPLGGADGVTKPDWQTISLKDFQFIGNKCDFTLYPNNQLQINHGTDGFLIKGNEITVKIGTAPIVIQPIDKTVYTKKDALGNLIYSRTYGGRNARNGLITKDNRLIRNDGRPELVSVPADATNVIVEA